MFLKLEKYSEKVCPKEITLNRDKIERPENLRGKRSREIRDNEISSVVFNRVSCCPIFLLKLRKLVSASI